MNYKVEHHPDNNVFNIIVDGRTARLSYVRMGGKIDFVSTHVPSELENKGIGSALVRAGLDYACKEGLKVEASCVFVEVFLKRHMDEYADLLK